MANLNEMSGTEKGSVTGMKINKLAYRLLGVLVRAPSTGYDIVKALEKFRPVQISQVYPLLTEMETHGILVSKEVIQEGKPNKKIYHPTPLANEVLREWIGRDTEEPLPRDEFLGKAYSLWVGSPEERERLVLERLEWLSSEIEYFTAHLCELHENHGELVNDPDTWQFCRDVLISRRLVLYNEEKLWCHRLLQKLNASNNSREPQS